MRSLGAAIAAICVFLVYLLIPTKTYYWDGVLFSLYAEQARAGQMSAGALFHANHLLYTFIGYFLSFPGIRAIRVFQIVNAVFGGVCAYLLYHFARRVSGSNIAAYAGTLLFASGATWWKFSTDADPYIIAVFFCMAAVWFAPRKGVWPLSAVIICHIVAMLCHELSIFLYFPVLYALHTTRSRLIYLAGSIVSVTIIYWAAYTVSGHPGTASFFAWIHSYAGDTPVTHNFQQIAVGYLGSYLKLFAGGKFSLMRALGGPIMIVALAASFALLVYSIRLWKRTTPAEGSLFPLLLVWFVPFALFLAIFDPASTFHKLFIWPPLVLLICFTARHRARSLLAASAALACWNFGAYIWPHSHAAADPVLSFANNLNHELPASAVVYYSSFSPDDWYLRYFGPKNDWMPLPVPANTGQTICLESTALNTFPQAWSGTDQRWSLVTSQHNIRLACFPSGRRF